MNQAELIDAIASQAMRHHDAGVSKTVVTAVLKTLTDVTTAELKKGNEVALPGLGKFTVTERAARTGRNPQTGEEIQIAARRAPKFSASKALKDAVA